MGRHKSSHCVNTRVAGSGASPFPLVVFPFLCLWLVAVAPVPLAVAPSPVAVFPFPCLLLVVVDHVPLVVESFPLVVFLVPC